MSLRLCPVYKLGWESTPLDNINEIFFVKLAVPWESIIKLVSKFVLTKFLLPFKQIYVIFIMEIFFVMYCISHIISVKILNFPYSRGCCWNCTFATNLKNKIEKYYHLDGEQQLAFLWKKYMSKNVGWENSRIFLRCAFSTFDLGEICLTRNEKFQFAFLTKALVNVKCQSRLGS